VGKGNLHLMDTVNVQKRWMTIYWRVNIFLTESHIVTHHANDRASFFKINDINDISFFWNVWLSSLLSYSVSVNANSMVNTLTAKVHAFLMDKRKNGFNPPSGAERSVLMTVNAAKTNGLRCRPCFQRMEKLKLSNLFVTHSTAILWEGCLTTAVTRRTRCSPQRH
jgi:hypothetical protein